MSIDKQDILSAADHQPGVEADPGDVWGSREDGGIGPVFDYMDEEIEEAMIPIGKSEASSGPSELETGRLGAR